MRKPASTLTTQELAIMKVVWRLGDVTVRDVYEALRETRRIAYTTVMTMMNILEAKGYLKKAKDDRAHRYRPARPERTARRGRSCSTWSRTAASPRRSARNCSS
jgi:predicted transcriptional regulator